ncbi:putative non-catalytic module family expn [Lyophyllum shimeji]|uniref:Non-catalytic module family expn n=1 Tax=Lyophyllum shimeji TaxID=47721 RepID=A0A9P3PH86_LYOSH|nr:putative non-catalytic module family expn [Lyophyllum shimeji]
MRFFASLVASVVSFAFLDTAFGAVHKPNAPPWRRHTARSPPAPLLGKNITMSERGESTLVKRFDNARFSFYDAGMGACGKMNSNSDFIVALNAPQFDSGDYCFKTITITWHGKSTQAQIVDKCMECPYGALDFSRGLFDYFSDESAGYLYGTWFLGSGEPPKPSPQPVPTTTKEKPTPTPTPTWTSTKTTSTHTTATTPSSSSLPATTSTSSATPSSTAIPFPTDVLSQLDLIMLNLGGVAIGAARARG